MLSIVFFGFFLGCVRFFRLRTLLHVYDCFAVVGGASDSRVNNDAFDNALAAGAILVAVLMIWLLIDDRFTFQNNYIFNQFALVLPEDTGINDLGFAWINGLAVIGGLCLGEGVRQIAGLFVPAFEDEIAGVFDGQGNGPPVTADVQAAAEICANLFDINARTGRLVVAGLATIYNLGPDQREYLNKYYMHNQNRSKRMSSVLKPLRKSMGKGSGAAHQFFDRIANVALASGHTDPKYITRLIQLAGALGVSAEHAQRTMEAFKFKPQPEPQQQSYSYSQSSGSQQSSQHYQSTDNFQSQQKTQPPPYRAPPTGRDMHLATLGLGATATSKEIKATYRKLAKKYHPDILKSKTLSDAEMAHAAKRMQEINDAYDYLEE
jgi:hypothetical protein